MMDDDIFDDLDDASFAEVTKSVSAKAHAPLVISTGNPGGGKAIRLMLRFSPELAEQFLALDPGKHRVKVEFNPVAMVLRLTLDNAAAFELSPWHGLNKKSVFLRIPLPNGLYAQGVKLEAKFTFRGKAMLVEVPDVFGRKPAPVSRDPAPAAAHPQRRVIVHSGPAHSFGDPEPGRSALDQKRGV